jgi:predicted homoserine dehydrogenase-like protein
MTYGEAVKAEEMCSERYLPEGLVEGCRLRTDIPKDAVLTYDDVDLPPGRLADRLAPSSTCASGAKIGSRIACW